jgi:CarD family transcriptional regulator
MTAAKAPIKAAAATPAPAPVKKVPANSNTRKFEFKPNDHVVYPTHGVGKVSGVVEQEVAGYKLELFIIEFEKDKMTLRVPVAKAKSVGMRKLSSPEIVGNALNTLKGRARIKRTMWSRRAQEYEAKIDSGDLVSIAEVVRDLHRAGGQPEQSYSERQLYEKALARMAREVAAVEKTDEPTAVKRVEGMLVKKAA